MYRRLFKDSPYVTDYNSLGTVMPGYDIKIQEDKVLISGPSASDYSKDSDGYVHLNDKLKFENNTYYFMGKEQYLKSHIYQDILRLTEEYSTQLNYPLFNSDFDYSLKNDQIYLLLDPILISLVNIDVAHLSNFLKNNNINLDIAGILPKSKIVADAIKGNKIHLL
jgi:hypothetical protein